jgi:hypothetical protein
MWSPSSAKAMHLLPRLRGFWISESCLHRWVKLADIEEGARPGATVSESAELRELRMSQHDWDDAHLINAALDVHHDDPAFGGGFNWSSQHLDPGGVDGSPSGVDESVDGQGRDAVARGAVASAGRGAGVLA